MAKIFFSLCKSYVDQQPREIFHWKKIHQNNEKFLFTNKNMQKLMKKKKVSRFYPPIVLDHVQNLKVQHILHGKCTKNYQLLFDSDEEITSNEIIVKKKFKVGFDSTSMTKNKTRKKNPKTKKFLNYHCLLFVVSRFLDIYEFYWLFTLLNIIVNHKFIQNYAASLAPVIASLCQDSKNFSNFNISISIQSKIK